jgi:hypothetical protein
VLALILVGGSFVELLTHKSLSRWVVALVVGVKTLEKEVAIVKELAQSVWVVEPREVSTSLATAILLGAVARQRHGAHEELRERLPMVAWQTYGCILRRPREVVVSPRSTVQPIRPRQLHWRGVYLWEER